ncbi:hypothetical protein VTH06DRAFT_7370 [Thermothelomyces fergusii]
MAASHLSLWFEQDSSAADARAIGPDGEPRPDHNQDEYGTWNGNWNEDWDENWNGNWYGDWNGYENDENPTSPETGEDGSWAGDDDGDRDAMNITAGSPDSHGERPQPPTPSDILRASTVI